ncbi:MAG: hypothetical protein AAF479_02280 [Pseudomonadota bacterium]
MTTHSNDTANELSEVDLDAVSGGLIDDDELLEVRRTHAFKDKPVGRIFDGCGDD